MIIRASALRLPIASGTVQCCVTSPPYWGLRDYGVAGQLGMEPTPEAYVANMVAVFREVRRVLRDDGVLFLNLGDSYAASSNTGGTKSIQGTPKRVASMTDKRHGIPAGLKPKDLVGIPWRVAFALQADGWYLRSDIIWSKPNPMPESVTDRPTKAHEYVFLLTKSQRYCWDSEAVKEPATHAGKVVTLGEKPLSRGQANGAGIEPSGNGKASSVTVADSRNIRSVWAIATQPYREAHFATMPEKLVEPCIKAGSKPGDWVLDPFAGSGTVGVVAGKLNRRFVGTELNPNYITLARKRMAELQPSVLEVAS
jgi:DNA modification methylase